MEVLGVEHGHGGCVYLDHDRVRRLGIEFADREPGFPLTIRERGLPFARVHELRHGVGDKLGFQTISVR